MRFERLAQDETGLRQRPFAGVDEQQNTVDHGQCPLDLAAEIGVTRGIDDVDLDVAVVDRRVLGEDRDALLALEVGRVHDPFCDVGVDAEGAGLPQHGIDKRRFTVVDVGNDRDISDVRTGSHSPRISVRAHVTCPARAAVVARPRQFPQTREDSRQRAGSPCCR